MSQGETKKRCRDLQQHHLELETNLAGRIGSGRFDSHLARFIILTSIFLSSPASRRQESDSHPAVTAINL
jgi:hypothetical protein